LKFKVFKDSKELIYFANKFFVNDRISSLKKDVDDCLDKHCAFPALLYCFSTIDLLGALYTGYAKEGSHTKDNFKSYAVRFMKNTNERYTNEQVDLLQGIFRHKMVHLAQPKLVVNDDRDRHIAWRYEYPEIANHLRIEKRQYQKIQNILTPFPIYYDHVLIISITKLLFDVIDSVTRKPDGYMAKLKDNHKSLQNNFDNAIGLIYDPKSN
jgi:hypothetical protein